MKKVYIYSVLIFFLFSLFLGCPGPNDGIDNESGYQLNYNQVTYVEANPDEGFNFGYYYYVPESIRNTSKKYILVEPNNYPSSTDDINAIDLFAQNIINSNRYNYTGRLNVVLLVPVFPRPKSNYVTVTHALTTDTLQMSGELKRIDLQLISMINDLKEKCQDNGLRIESKFLMTGFSASGAFVNRFTSIHPELVQAVASGGNSSTPILPVETLEGESLIYPVGIANLEPLTGKAFDFKQYEKVPQFIYVGSEDTGNDPVPYDDMFKPDERRISLKILGGDKVSRWQSWQAIIKQLDCVNIVIVTYLGVGHVITGEMYQDIISFFRSNM